jgi:hypothetical protein
MRTLVRKKKLVMPVASRLSSVVALLLVLVFQISSAQSAQIIYDNSGPGDPTGAWYSPVEYGDEIVLGTNITSHVLTQFQFEYYGDFTPTGDEKADVRIYKNDGPLTADGIPMPGTVLYDSGPFNISTNYETWTSTFLDITLPDDVTWTVQFSGLKQTQGDRAGLLFQNPPTVGSSYNDAWQRTDTAWKTVVFSQPANFAARMTSDLPVVSIRQSAQTVVVEWAGTAILQEASAVGGPYEDRPQFRNKYTFSTHNAPVKFWRLRD